jgi:hypothetical protein
MFAKQVLLAAVGIFQGVFVGQAEGTKTIHGAKNGD